MSSSDFATAHVRRAPDHIVENNDPRLLGLLGIVTHYPDARVLLETARHFSLRYSFNEHRKKTVASLICSEITPVAGHAYLPPSPPEMRLNPAYGDADLVAGLCHELFHVAQNAALGRLHDYGLTEMISLPSDAYFCLRVTEASAYAFEVQACLDLMRNGHLAHPPACLRIEKQKRFLESSRFLGRWDPDTWNNRLFWHQSDSLPFAYDATFLKHRLHAIASTNTLLDDSHEPLEMFKDDFLPGLGGGFVRKETAQSLRRRLVATTAPETLKALELMDWMVLNRHRVRSPAYQMKKLHATWLVYKDADVVEPLVSYYREKRAPAPRQ